MRHNIIHNIICPDICIYRDELAPQMIGHNLKNNLSLNKFGNNNKNKFWKKLLMTGNWIFPKLMMS